MKYTESLIQRIKNIALVAYDNKKNDLVEWPQWNKPVLQRHNIFATGTTGQLMEAELEMTIPTACNRATADFLNFVGAHGPSLPAAHPGLCRLPCPPDRCWEVEQTHNP